LNLKKIWRRCQKSGKREKQRGGGGEGPNKIEKSGETSMKKTGKCELVLKRGDYPRGSKQGKTEGRRKKKGRVGEK